MKNRVVWPGPNSTSLDSSRLTQQGGQTARFFPQFLSSKKSSEKSSRLARALADYTSSQNHTIGEQLVAGTKQKKHDIPPTTISLHKRRPTLRRF